MCSSDLQNRPKSQSGRGCEVRSAALARGFYERSHSCPMPLACYSPAAPLHLPPSMKLLLDFLPLVLFFIAYKLAGIYAATAVIMAATALQMPEAACPRHTVWICGLMYCIVS